MTNAVTVMLPLNISKHGKARVWLEELPLPPRERADVLEIALHANTLLKSERMSAAVEVCLASGPMQPYALVGGTFEPSIELEHLAVRISFAEPITHTDENPISSSVTKAQMGLSLEYARAVMAALQEIEAQLPPGRLTINVSRESICDSSEWIFSRAAKALLFLFAYCMTGRSDQAEVQNLVRDKLLSD